LFSAGQLATYNHLSSNDSKALLWPKIGSAVWGVFLNGYGAYAAGLKGVVWASVIFSCTYFGWILLSVRRLEINSIGEHAHTYENFR